MVVTFPEEMALGPLSIRLPCYCRILSPSRLGYPLCPTRPGCEMRGGKGRLASPRPEIAMIHTPILLLSLIHPCRFRPSLEEYSMYIPRKIENKKQKSAKTETPSSATLASQEKRRKKVTKTRTLTAFIGCAVQQLRAKKENTSVPIPTLFCS